MTRTGFISVFFLFILSAAAFASPVALVEEINASSTKVQMLDFLSAGDEIELGKNGNLVLGYLNSCIREEISGGKVIVGESQSRVSGGTVNRSKTQCDGGGLVLSANEAIQSGAMAYRSLMPKLEPSLTVYHVSPLLVLSKAGKVVIKRVDQKGERYSFNARAAADESRLGFDLKEKGVKLTPGADYMLSSGGKSMVFSIDKGASEKTVNMVSRMIPL